MLSVTKLKSEARKRLKKKWVDAAAFEVLWLAIGWFLWQGAQTSARMSDLFAGSFFRDRGMMMLVMLLLAVGFYGLIVLASGALQYIHALYFTRLVNGKKADLSVFREWQSNFSRNLAVTVYQYIFTIILTFVLGLIVALASGLFGAHAPAQEMMFYTVMVGIFISVSLIVGLYFSQVWLILVDQPKMDAWEAIKRSALLMCHHEGYYLFLLLSFVGWAILSVFTMGLGVIFLIPYMSVAQVLFYQEIRPNLVTTIKQATAEAAYKVRGSVSKAAKKAKKKLAR